MTNATSVTRSLELLLWDMDETPLFGTEQRSEEETGYRSPAAAAAVVAAAVATAISFATRACHVALVAILTA